MFKYTLLSKIHGKTNLIKMLDAKGPYLNLGLQSEPKEPTGYQ